MPTDTVWIIDFDRTLSSNLLYELIEAAFVNIGLGITEFDNMKIAANRNGGSIDVLTYLSQQRINSDAFIAEYEMLAAKYNATDLLAAGAQTFLDKLRHDGAPWVILTYGNEHWQRLKLQIVGLGGAPVIITDSPDKSQQIASWFDARDGKFHVPLTTPQPHAILIDDKKRAFDAMPPQMRGLWMNGDRDKTPKNVDVIDSFQTLLDVKA